MSWVKQSLTLLSPKKRREDFDSNRRYLSEMASEQRQKARIFREAYEHSGQRDWLELAKATEEDARELEREKQKKERVNHWLAGVGVRNGSGN